MKSVAADFAPESYQRGIEFGMKKGVINLLVMEIGTRFGFLPIGYAAKLNAIDDVDTLISVGVSILKTETIEEFKALVDIALEGHQLTPCNDEVLPVVLHCQEPAES